MGLKTPTSSGSRKNIEAGNYPARLVQVIDLGVQTQQPYQGEEKPPVQMIQVTYELTDEFMVDENGNDILDKPRWISESFPLYSLGSDRAKSTARYKALDPEMVHDGDWSLLVGQACMVNVVNKEGKGNHAGKVFDNVGSISTMRARDIEKTPELVNPPKVFILDEPSLEVFNSFPDFVKDKIKANIDFRGSKLEELLASQPEDGADSGNNPPAASDDDDAQY